MQTEMQSSWPFHATEGSSQMISKEDAVVLSAYTGVLMCDFADLHTYIEQKLERPVFTHEMASDDLQKELKKASKADLLSILPRNGGE